MRVTYNGPSMTLNGVKRGNEIELTDRQISLLTAAGHKFTPVDGRRNLPEPDTAAYETPVVEVEETVEPDEP